MEHDDHEPSPEESWRIIDAQRQAVRDKVGIDERILYGAWGLAWVIGYTAMFADADDAGDAGGIGGIVFGGSLMIAMIVTVVHSVERSRGLGGAAARINGRIGLIWPIAFAAVFAIISSMFSAGLDGPGVAVVANGLPCLVVACIFMAGGAATDDGRQFWLGVWIAVVVAAASFVGQPHLYVVMAAAGGGGFLVAAYLDHHARLTEDADAAEPEMRF